MNIEAVSLAQTKKLPITAAKSLIVPETQIRVDYEKILYASQRAGVTWWQLHEASLHFSDQSQQPTTALGVMDGNEIVTKTMRRRYRRDKHSERLGIHPDQFGDVYPVAVNMPHRSAIRSKVYSAVCNEANGVIVESQLEDLEDGDLLSIVLAHEMRHISQWNIRSRFLQTIGSLSLSHFGLTDLEADSFSYTAECLEQGANNPWLGTVQVY